MSRLKQVETIEMCLGMIIPDSYRKYLLECGSKNINGYPVMGLSTKIVPTSFVSGIENLRKKRPDLPSKFIPIVFEDNYALCLDLRKDPKEDAPLVMISLDLSIDQDKEILPIGLTFSQWYFEHQEREERFDVAMNKIKNRKAETEGARMQDWSTAVFRVQNFIIGMAAFRFSFSHSCLEVDEFYPVFNPTTEDENAGLKLLIEEAFARSRDYTGSLQLMFTRDIREDDNGKIKPESKWEKIVEKYPENFRDKIKRVFKWRLSRSVPYCLVDLARKYNINFSQSSKGIISHEEGVKLWFALQEFPVDVATKIMELENAGYLNREIISEIVSIGIWSKEEVIWIFRNAPRPEVLLLGSETPGDRLSYVEALNFGRSAFLTTRFSQAIKSEMSDGVFEEDDSQKYRCIIEPLEDFFVLKCSDDFYLPPSWTVDKSKRHSIKAGESVLILSRPRFPASPDYEVKRIINDLDLLTKSKTGIKHKCLILTYEFISPDYNKDVNKIKEIAKQALIYGVQILFAPSRMMVYLDEDIQKRMQRCRNLKKFPSQSPRLKLSLVEIPAEYWNVPEGVPIRRAIQNASESVVMFAQQVVNRTSLKRYRRDFNFMCEVIEREALSNHKILAETLSEENSAEIIDALKYEGGVFDGISFSFVQPQEVENFMRKIRRPSLCSLLRQVKGGMVFVVKPWERNKISTVKAYSSTFREPQKIPESLIKIINDRIAERKDKRQYVSHWKEIDVAHRILRQSIEKGTPFSISSIQGKVRSHVFAEVVKDYIYQATGAKELMIPIAYGDGSEGEVFPLFSLKEMSLGDLPISEDLFIECSVGMVTMRHMEADKYLDMTFIRNNQIQNRENSAEQEGIAFRRTYECIDELFSFIDGKMTDPKKHSLNLKLFLGRKPLLSAGKAKGVKLHLFHTTGLESSGVGIYRALMTLIAKYRGRLIVVPRILGKNNEYSECESWF